MTGENDHCSECGMVNVSDEFHSRVLCLLVKARNGNTIAARKDMAFIVGAARSQEPFTQRRVSTFMANQQREERNRRGR